MRRKPARTIVWSSAMTTRTTFTPLTPTLSPVGRGGALRGNRRGLLSRPSPQPSPLWGEGERCAETDADYFHAPHPNPLPCGERGSVARKPTRTTFTPLTPTLSPVGRGGALRGNRRGLLSRPSPQPSPLWGEGERCAETDADYFHAPHPNPLPCGERGSVARKPTRTTFTPLTPTLSPVGGGGALRRWRLGLLSPPPPPPPPPWGGGGGWGGSGCGLLSRTLPRTRPSPCA